MFRGGDRRPESPIDQFHSPPEDVYEYGDAIPQRLPADIAPAWILEVAQLDGCANESVVEAVSSAALSYQR